MSDPYVPDDSKLYRLGPLTMEQVGEIEQLLREGAMEVAEPDYEGATKAIDPFKVFIATDGKPGIRTIQRSQDEVARLAVDAAYR